MIILMQPPDECKWMVSGQASCQWEIIFKYSLTSRLKTLIYRNATQLGVHVVLIQWVKASQLNQLQIADMLTFCQSVYEWPCTGARSCSIALFFLMPSPPQPCPSASSAAQNHGKKARQLSLGSRIPGWDPKLVASVRSAHPGTLT